MGQLGFSSTFSEWVQLIPFLRLDMVDNILWDALFCPHLGDQILYPAKNLLDELTGVGVLTPIPLRPGLGQLGLGGLAH